jgi:hypothetical protein
MYFIGVSSAPASRSKLGNYKIRIATAQPNTPRQLSLAPDGQSRWLPVGTGRNSTIDFDRTSVTVTGNQTYLFWQRSTYATPYTDKTGDTSDVVLVQYEVACADRQFRLKAGPKSLEGRLVRTSTFAGRWESPVPESVAEMTVNTVCVYARQRGM